MSVIEMTTFTVAPENTRAMLDARPGMVEAFRADRRGFVSARLVRVAEDTWLDVVEWTDDSAWDESIAKGANLPAIAAFFGTIGKLVGAERGVRYDDSEDGRRPVRTIAYGPAPSQVGELYLPDGDGPFPVVVLVHGGYWAAMWDRRQITGVADDLVGRGTPSGTSNTVASGSPAAGGPGPSSTSRPLWTPSTGWIPHSTRAAPSSSATRRAPTWPRGRRTAAYCLPKHRAPVPGSPRSASSPSPAYSTSRPPTPQASASPSATRTPNTRRTHPGSATPKPGRRSPTPSAKGS